MDRKALAPQIKAVTGDGTVTIVMATLNVPDHDGDVTERGFFGEQTAQIVPAHDWAHVPLGKARVREVGNEAVADLSFNLDVPAAADWYKAIKYDFENPPALQQYSYGFDVLDGGARYGDFQGRQVRFLQPLKSGAPGVQVFEVSPVMLGAGLGTRTLAVKQDRQREPLTEAQMAVIRTAQGHAAEHERKQRAVFERAQSHVAAYLLEKAIKAADACIRAIDEDLANARWYVELAADDVPMWKRAVAEIAASKYSTDLGYPLPIVRWFRDETTAERHYLEVYAEPASKGFGWLGKGWLVGMVKGAGERELWLNAGMSRADEIDATTAHEVRHLTGGSEDQAQAYERRAHERFWDMEAAR